MDKNTAQGRRSVVEEARRAIAVQGTVDVIELADHLGLSVYQKKLPDNSSGYIEYKGGDTRIIVNSGHPLTRQRFTIAHELGHYVYDNDKLVALGRLDRDKYRPADAQEKEADTFAAEILMPADETKDLVDMLNGKRIDASFIQRVADHFRVSRPMALLRLREIGIPVPYVEFA